MAVKPPQTPVFQKQKSLSSIRFGAKAPLTNPIRTVPAKFMQSVRMGKDVLPAKGRANTFPQCQPLRPAPQGESRPCHSPPILFTFLFLLTQSNAYARPVSWSLQTLPHAAGTFASHPITKASDPAERRNECAAGKERGTSLLRGYINNDKSFRFSKPGLHIFPFPDMEYCPAIPRL